MSTLRHSWSINVLMEGGGREGEEERKGRRGGEERKNTRKVASHDYPQII